MTVRASSTVTTVIGWPVGHSLSPVIHNAAFDAVGLDWVMVASAVEPGEGPAAMEALRTLGLAGASVTMPHKSDVVAGLDVVSDAAARLGAVNCVVHRDGRLEGHNTDGAGFVAALREDTGLDPHGVQCVVVGAGGAARAVVLALAEAGAASVVVVNRDAVRARAAAELGGRVGSVGTLDAVREAQLVVNATPVGMGDDLASPIGGELLGAHHVVVDLVYHPLETTLLRLASSAGARCANGLSMLVHQAGAAFELWTGATAPLDAMRAGVLAELFLRSSGSGGSGSNGPRKS